VSHSIHRAPSSNAWLWSADTAAGSNCNAVAINITVNCTGVVALYSAAATWWGAPNVALASIRLSSSAGRVAATNISYVGNVDVRDYYPDPSWTNTIVAPRPSSPGEVSARCCTREYCRAMRRRSDGACRRVPTPFPDVPSDAECVMKLSIGGGAVARKGRGRSG
jgi:hypothetical protein